MPTSTLVLTDGRRRKHHARDRDRLVLHALKPIHEQREVCDENQRVRSGLRRRGFGRCAWPGMARGDRRGPQPDQGGADQRGHHADHRKGHRRDDREGGRPKDGCGPRPTRARGGARDRAFADLRGHAQSQLNGNLDLSYVRRVCEEIGAALEEKDAFHVVVARSTMLPGTMRKVVIPTLEQSSGKQRGHGLRRLQQPRVPARRHGGLRLLPPAQDGDRGDRLPRPAIMLASSTPSWMRR